MNQKIPSKRIKVDSLNYDSVKNLLKNLNLNTVCTESRCPNQAECYSQKTATFLILGNVCTRNCRFCAIKSGNPLPPKSEEPKNVAAAVTQLKLKYVVITSVTRDDLHDKGVRQFVETVNAIKKTSLETKIELLVPDFDAKLLLLKKIFDSSPTVISHNLETTPRLYPKIRNLASYARSLKVISIIAQLKRNSKVYSPFIKTSLMLGLGETKPEVEAVIKDLKSVGCEFVTIGQYLQPSPRQVSVTKYLTRPEFDYYKNFALKQGFRAVYSDTYVRSSYYAEKML